MSITTWIDATVTNVCKAGTIGHRVATTSTAQHSVVTWECGSQSVLLGESSLLGRKRAVYEVLNNPATIGKIRRLEGEQSKRNALTTMAKYDSEVAHLMGIEPEFGPVIIESDPYVALGV